MDHVYLTQDMLNVQAISDLVASPKCGAISIFVGTTRDNFDDKTVVKLEYEVYESMAIKCMTDICADLRGRWTGIENIAIYHRYGTVPIKEASVIIAISSPHRADAISATEACIDSVKKSVPIWKKEVYEDNIAEWKENKECTQHPPRARLFKLEQKPEIQALPVPAHLIQVKVDTNEIDRRIEKFMQRKRDEVNENNTRNFCPAQNSEHSGCARVDTKYFKWQTSKSEMHKNRTFKDYYRDQPSLNYIKKFQKKSGTEERIQNLELQTGILLPTDSDIYSRIKYIEDRLLHMESISPEYVQFFGKNVFSLQTHKKRIFSLNEIESMISHLENKKSKTSHDSSDEDKL